MALGIAAFCMIVLFTLIPVGLASRKEAVQNTMAAGIASEVLADLRSTGSASTSKRFQLAIPSPGSSSTLNANPQTFYLANDGARTGGLGAGPTTSGLQASTFRVTIGFGPPPSADAKSSTALRILVTWPALASPNPKVWPTNFNDSYEVLTSLNRN